MARFTGYFQSVDAGKLVDAVSIPNYYTGIASTPF